MIAKIGRTTLYRWMEDGEFRSNLEHLRDQSANLAHAELRGLMLKDVLVLAEVFEDPSYTVATSAALATLETGLKANDMRDYKRRLDLLDDAFALST